MLDKEIYNQLFKTSFSRTVEVTFWDGTVKIYGSPEQEVAFKIRFFEKIPVKDLLKNASLALGEAYMDKKIEIEGNLQELFYDISSQVHNFTKNSYFMNFIPKQNHRKKQSVEDIHSHYDLGNDFYKLWLDKTMTYSCAFFESKNDTLEQAQINKVHHILDKLFISPGDTLLDIGCGWGTLIVTAAKEYGVKATGITLSQEQYDHISKIIANEHLEELVEVLLLDYRDLRGRTFDHITSVGMFEHVGPENLKEYFKVIETNLAPKGTALIHGICRQQGETPERGGGKNAWINKYIFPGGYIPKVSEIVNDVTEDNLQLFDFESLRRDYQWTLERWAKRFHNVKEQVIAQKGERFYRMWDLYLQTCAAAFQSSNIDVIQYFIVHPNNNTMSMHRRF